MRDNCARGRDHSRRQNDPSRRLWRQSASTYRDIMTLALSPSPPLPHHRSPGYTRVDGRVDARYCAARPVRKLNRQT